MSGDILPEILLQGKIVDLKEAEEEVTVDSVKDWQTDSLRSQIKKAGLRKKGYMMPLMDAHDITTEEHHLAKDFMPEIKLTGLELRAERNSKAWGGYYFRVLKSKDDKSRAIQHIFVWTKQRFFVSFWVTVLPLFLLGIVGTLIFSYLNLREAIISIAIIGGLFILLGLSAIIEAAKGLVNGHYAFSNKQLFVVFGLGFWVLIAEMYLSPVSAGTYHIVVIGEEVIETVLDHSLSFSWVSILFFIAGFIALILWKWDPPAFTHATHDMDWAPFFVYLKRSKEEGKKWELDKVRYDAFHYYADTMTYEELKNEGALNRDHLPRFTIPSFWHSFEPKSGINNWFIVLFGLLIFIIGTLLGIISFLSPDSPLMSVLRFVIFPLMLFFGAYLAFSNWPANTINKSKIEYSDPKYHLTEDRLRIFWNLKGEEPALKVRSKLQDAFMENEDFTTFRDDIEKIVLYSVLPKLAEVEQQMFFKRL